MKLSEEIRGWMRRKQLRTKDVAALCGVSGPAVSQWLSGNSSPRARHLRTLIQNGLAL